MIDRLLKALFALILGAMALLYVIHNIANIGQAQAFFTYVTSHADQHAYPVTLLPVPPPALVVVAMALVFALEIAAGVLLVWAALLMAAGRTKTAAFQKGVCIAKIGIGCAVANWWGLFQAIAGAGYQMWQIEGGRDPFYSSLLFGAMYVLLLIVLNQRSEGRSATAA
jgi:predicted small integral membrane protein